MKLFDRNGSARFSTCRRDALLDVQGTISFQVFQASFSSFFLCYFTKHRLLVLTERIGTISSRLSIRRVLPPPPMLIFFHYALFAKKMRSLLSTFSSLILFATLNSQLRSQLPTFFTSSHSLSYHPLSTFDT